ncbi:uncharacterized protein LAESUDRAFT_715747 [Laetiporus sulphureus 93-53]|uniref:Ketopantoate reductase N-terminal domain-containing protein n=1 Tax=Laetiporus sulphureus 93-53 TaxID=1314785 RepID=A0A165D629_9APHY|nr:uncharacterized protein LAESUDRAFT_715747 [Laetiporus sulphureus 93-53]KZT04218.1 hypothetical protein LAESUDRAFT_715747 [Laetiporus sulphureus 93-53]
MAAVLPKLSCVVHAAATFGRRRRRHERLCDHLAEEVVAIFVRAGIAVSARTPRTMAAAVPEGAEHAGYPSLRCFAGSSEQVGAHHGAVAHINAFVGYRSEEKRSSRPIATRLRHSQAPFPFAALCQREYCSAHLHEDTYDEQDQVIKQPENVARSHDAETDIVLAVERRSSGHDGVLDPGELYRLAVDDGQSHLRPNRQKVLRAATVGAQQATVDFLRMPRYLREETGVDRSGRAILNSSFFHRHEHAEQTGYCFFQKHILHESPDPYDDYVFKILEQERLRRRVTKLSAKDQRQQLAGIQKNPKPSPIESLIVAVKAQSAIQGIMNLLPRISSNSTIVLLHNGMGVYENLIKAVFRNREQRPNVVVSVNNHGAFLKQEGHVVHTGVGDIKLGIVPDPKGRDFEVSLDTSLPKEDQKLSLDDIAPLSGDPLAQRYSICV